MTQEQQFYFGIIPHKIWAYWKSILRQLSDAHIDYIKMVFVKMV